MTIHSISSKGSWGEAGAAAESSMSSESVRVRVAVRALSVEANRLAGLTVVVAAVVLDSWSWITSTRAEATAAVRVEGSLFEGFCRLEVEEGYDGGVQRFFTSWSKSESGGEEWSIVRSSSSVDWLVPDITMSCIVMVPILRFFLAA